MEDARIGAPKLVESKLMFPPHRRSHLKSDTYRTLVRILSPFCGSDDVSLATEFDPQQLRHAYTSHLKQSTIESSGQPVDEDFVRPEIGDSAMEKVTVVEDGMGMDSLEDGCFHESEVKMNVIKDVSIVERSDNGSAERELQGASSQENHCVHEESHRDKLEAANMVEGNKVLIDDNSSNKTRSLDQTNCGNDQISPKKFTEEIVEHQQVMAEQDAVNRVQNLSMTIFSSEGDNIGEASKHKDNQENILPIVDKAMYQLTETQPKESKPEGIVCEPYLEMEKSHVSSFEVMEVEDGEQCSEKVCGVDLSCLDKEMPFWANELSKNSEDWAVSMDVDTSEVGHKIVSEDIQMEKCLIENEDIEEGEICGDSTHEISEDPAVLDEKHSSIQANGEAKKPDSLFSDIVENATHENKEESKQKKSNLDACKHGSMDSVKMVTTIIEDQNDFMLEEAGYTVKDSRPNRDANSFTARISNQVPRGQVPSECATGRKEIASTEKETGACNKKKRGSCTEGRKERKKIQKRKKRAEKNRKLGVKRLKLLPVTVPKPVVYCRHYIKGRCHEGDKCKFSHDTTPATKSVVRYWFFTNPCSYFARHSCMKGDDCPFDHQLFKYPCSNFVSKGSCPRGDTCMFSHKILPQEQSNMQNLKTQSKPPVIPDSFDSQRKSNISGGTKQKPVTVTVPSYAGASCNRTPQGESLLKKTTGPLPTGISFLSFGKSPDHSSQVKNDDVERRNSLTQSGLCSVENSSEISRKIQPQRAPEGISILSFGRTSLKSNSENLATPSSYNAATITSGNQTPSSSKTGHDPSELAKKVQTTTSKPMNFFSPMKESMYVKPEGLSTIFSRLPGTSMTTGQYSDSSASSMNKGTPNSAQKALLSTLAFAAKYESMNKGKSSASAGSNAGNKEDRNEKISGSLKNDQAKASKLLDFLLGVGSKSNLK
ncbi:Zinc finger CCCH domain-containing protein 65 [Cucurbita argyrosperma subsp. argyrosperma]|nr:Zinc finger CCCH domain-containing protein 65 [Cucurbita argyrosperma subsp. argyrosperma]